MLAAAVLCWVVLSPARRFGGPDETEVRLSVSQARVLLEPVRLGEVGPQLYPRAALGPLNLKRAQKDASYLKMRARLLAGAKLTSLVKTNPSLFDCAAAYAVYVNIPGVMVTVGTPEPRLGGFDSGKYATRWAAARGMRELLAASGLRTLRLASNTVAFLPERDCRLLVAAGSAARQRALVKAFEEEKDPARKKEAGEILSVLRRAGFLEESLKKRGGEGKDEL